jgi:tRNA nucleotidyltransferase (CCA-adding enzyme)
VLLGKILSDLLPEIVREQVLAQITPTKEEMQNQNEVIAQLTEALAKQAEATEFVYSFIEAQGSTGRKQTQLRGASDIDLFIGLKPEDYPETLDRQGTDRHDAIDFLMKSLVEKWFSPAVERLNVERVQRAFSQHPFLSLQMRGLEVDILGCFDIDAETLSRKGPITAVDRTVHHSRYVTEHLTEKKREDARILKSFVRASHAYGDTCAVGRMGITGVSLELMVIFTPDLDSAMQRLQTLDLNPLDPLNRTLEELQRIPAFRDDHVFLIDPTDPSRNVASSFTPRAYRWIQYRAIKLHELLESGKNENVIDEFLEKPIPDDDLPAWLKFHCFSYEFKSDGGTHYTILRDKIHRLARMLEANLANERMGEPRFGEILTEVYFRDDMYALGLLIEQPVISQTYLRRGPPIHLDVAAKEFKLAHQSTIEVDGYLCIEEEREWTYAPAMIEMLLQENPIEGLELVDERSQVSKQVLNVLCRYILPLEPALRERMTRVKHTAEKLGM